MRQISFFPKERLIKLLSSALLGILLTGFSKNLPQDILVEPNYLMAQSSNNLESVPDWTSIKEVAVQSLDLPDSVKLEFPLVMSYSDYAMVGWVADHVGGLLFLRKDTSTWSVIPGTGGGVPDVEHLVSVGIPRNVAQGFMDYLNNPNK